MDIIMVRKEAGMMRIKMLEINEFLLPMVKQDMARRDDAMWNLWATSGGIYAALERFERDVGFAIREIMGESTDI